MVIITNLVFLAKNLLVVDRRHFCFFTKKSLLEKQELKSLLVTNNCNIIIDNNHYFSGFLYFAKASVLVMLHIFSQSFIRSFTTEKEKKINLSMENCKNISQVVHHMVSQIPNSQSRVPKISDSEPNLIEVWDWEKIILEP